SVLYCYFLYYGDHRHLHSFPTRRSSDLDRIALGQIAAVTGDLGQRGQPAQDYALVVGPGGGAVVLAVPGDPVVDQAGRADEASRDRKSTRLNSSHDQISYAVFCLKKQTQ